MANTPNLTLPYIDQNQSQKHVTHNAALRELDALVHLSVIRDDWSAPPATPADGDRYIVAASPTGAWAGHGGHVAAWQDGAWMFYVPRVGWRCFVALTAATIVYNGTWTPLISELQTLLLHGSFEQRAAHGGKTEFRTEEELITLAGATTNSTLLIPNGAILYAVSNRVVTAITGATSYNCGDIDSPSRFGGGLGIGLGSLNRGQIGPMPYYADKAVIYTAIGGNFTGGQVRMTMHYLKPTWATS